MPNIRIVTKQLILSINVMTWLPIPVGRVVLTLELTQTWDSCSDPLELFAKCSKNEIVYPHLHNEYTQVLFPTLVQCLCPLVQIMVHLEEDKRNGDLPLA